MSTLDSGTDAVDSVEGLEDLGGLSHTTAGTGGLTQQTPFVDFEFVDEHRRSVYVSMTKKYK